MTETLEPQSLEPTTPKGVDPDILPIWELPRLEAEGFYHEAYELNDTAALRWFAKNDRYFLLTCILNRADARNDWLYARCREVRGMRETLRDPLSPTEKTDTGPRLGCSRGFLP